MITITEKDIGRRVLTYGGVEGTITAVTSARTRTWYSINFDTKIEPPRLNGYGIASAFWNYYSNGLWCESESYPELKEHPAQIKEFLDSNSNHLPPYGW